MLTLLDYVAERYGGEEDGGKKREKRVLDIQFDHDLIPWATEELKQILRADSTGIAPADVVDEIFRFRQTTTGQRKMKELLLGCVELIKDPLHKDEAKKQVAKFLATLFAKATQMKEQKEKDRRRLIKSRWTRAGLAASLKTKKEYVDEAPLLQCRPRDQLTEEKKAARSMGIQGPPVERPFEERSGSRLSSFTELYCTGQLLREPGWDTAQLCSAEYEEDTVLFCDPQSLERPLLRTRGMPRRPCGVQELPELAPASAHNDSESELVHRFFAKNNEVFRQVGQPADFAVLWNRLAEEENVDPDEQPRNVPFPELSLLDRVEASKVPKASKRGGAFPTPRKPDGPPPGPPPMSKPGSADAHPSTSSSSRPPGTPVVRQPPRSQRLSLLIQESGEGLKGGFPSPSGNAARRRSVAVLQRMEKVDEMVHQDSSGIIQTLFDKYDFRNKDGYLDKAQLSCLLSQLASVLYHEEYRATGDDVDFIMCRCKISRGTEPVEPEDLMDALKVWDFYMQQKSVIDTAFRKYDTNNAGRLEKDQLAAFLEDLAVVHGVPPPAPYDVVRVMKKADITETGSIMRMELAHAGAAFLIHKHQEVDNGRFDPALCNWIWQKVQEFFGTKSSNYGFGTTAEWHKEIFDEICTFRPVQSEKRRIVRYLHGELKQADLACTMVGGMKDRQLDEDEIVAKRDKDFIAFADELYERVAASRSGTDSLDAMITSATSAWGAGFLAEPIRAQSREWSSSWSLGRGPLPPASPPGANRPPGTPIRLSISRRGRS